MKRLALALLLALTACGSPTPLPGVQAQPPGPTVATPAPTPQQQAQARARAHLSPLAQAAQVPSAAPFAWSWWDGKNLLQSQKIRAEQWQELNDFRADFELTGPGWDAFERALKRVVASIARKPPLRPQGVIRQVRRMSIPRTFAAVLPLESKLDRL